MNEVLIYKCEKKKKIKKICLMFRSDLESLVFTKVTQCLPGYWVRKQLIKCLLLERLQQLQDDSCWGPEGSWSLTSVAPQILPFQTSQQTFLLALHCHRIGRSWVSHWWSGEGRTMLARFRTRHILKVKSRSLWCFRTKGLWGAGSTKAGFTSLRSLCCLFL